LVVMIIGLLVVSDQRRTSSVNSADLGIDLDREGVWVGGREDHI